MLIRFLAYQDNHNKWFLSKINKNALLIVLFGTIKALPGFVDIYGKWYTISIFMKDGNYEKNLWPSPFINTLFTTFRL